MCCIHAGKLPHTGFEPFQILNFDEANCDPQGKPQRALISPENTDASRAQSGDRAPFHVTYGCVASAAGDILSVQIIHAHPDEKLTFPAVQGIVELKDGKYVTPANVDVFMAATHNGWQNATSSGLSLST